MKTAAIYCRVSTEDQERDGTSLISQQEASIRYCQAKDYRTVNQFSDVYSGLSIDRPKLNQLRELVRKKQIQVVVIYCLDRLTRDPAHGALLQDEMEKHNVKLEAVTETIDSTDLGKLISYIRCYAAKMESDKLRERTQRGIRERVKAGKMPSGQRAKLYGYTYRDGVRHINESEAKVVQDMFNWLIGGETVNGITYRLRDMGIPTPSGQGYWSRSTVHKLLCNESYTGRTYVYNREMEIPNATPAIILADVFSQTQAILKRNKERSVRNGKVNYLLRNHLVCSHCGRKYWGYARAGTGQRFYYCMGRRSIITPVKCDNRGFNADYIEDAIWQRVEALLSDPEAVIEGIRVRQSEMEGQNLMEKELETVKLQLANREKQKDRIFKTFYIVGDEARFRHDLAELETEVKSLQQRKDELEKQAMANQQFSLDVEGIKQACQLVRDNLKTFTYDEKRLALEALAIKVLVDGDQIVVNGAIPVCNIVSTRPYSGGNNVTKTFPFALAIK